MSLKTVEFSSLEDKIQEWIKQYEIHSSDINLNKLREILTNIIIKFIIDKNYNHECVNHLNNKERKYIHELAGGCGLKTRSRGKKENRKIFIKKPSTWDFDNTKFIYIGNHQSGKYNKTGYNNSLSKEENNFIQYVENEIDRIIGCECEKCNSKLTKENILDGFYLAYNLYKNKIFCCNCLEKMPMSPYKEELVGIYTEDLEKYKSLINL